MSSIKVGTYAIGNINPKLIETTYHSYMIISIVQNKSSNVITLGNIFNTSDILTIIQTKDGFFHRNRTDLETLTFKEFLEDDLFINPDVIPHVLLDLVGKKYSGPNGEFTVGQKLIEGLKEYPYNHELIRRLIKYLPDKFLIDLYERFPFPYIGDQNCDQEFIDEFYDILTANIKLHKLYIYEGKFDPYKEIDERIPDSDGGHVIDFLFDGASNDTEYKMRETLDYEVKKKFILHARDKEVDPINARDKDIINIYIEEELEPVDEIHIYIVADKLFYGDDSDDISELENIHKYHDLFFQQMDTEKVNESVDYIMDRYKKLMKQPKYFGRIRPDKEHAEVIISMINRLRNPVMTKSAYKT